jgi:hypothetical protein
MIRTSRNITCCAPPVGYSRVNEQMTIVLKTITANKEAAGCATVAPRI